MRKMACVGSVMLQTILILFAAVMYIFAAQSFCFTCSIDQSSHGAYVGEHILIFVDSLWHNGAVVCIFLCGVMLLRRIWRGGPAARITRIAEWGMLIWIAVLGSVWVLAARSIPAADSGILSEIAVSAAKNDFSVLKQYERYIGMFPYQLGFIFVLEWFIRITQQSDTVLFSLVNVACLVLGYAALVCIARRIFQDERIVLLTILLLACCIQPVLFCTFIYGNLMGLMAMLWSVWCVVVYIQTNRRRMLLFCGLLLAFAIFVKPNYWIATIAVALVLVIHGLLERHFINFAAIAGLLVLPLLFCTMIQRGYEVRSGISLGEGLPQTTWLTMGLQESTAAPGWYNGYPYRLMEQCAGDPGEISIQIQKDIQERMDIFRRDPAYAFAFFGKKLSSQWNETTFESIWISEVKEHAEAVPNFARSIYDGRAGKALTAYFDQYMQIIYVFCLMGGVYCLFAQKRLRLLLSLPMLIFFGAVLYHLLFEAKSQYALVYIPLLVPMAAYGIERVSALVGNRLFHQRKL